MVQFNQIDVKSHRTLEIEEEKKKKESSENASVVRRSDECEGNQSQVRMDSSQLINTKQTIHIKLV